MLKYHLLNTESWKEELQDGLKKAEVGTNTRMIIVPGIKCYATDTNYNFFLEITTA